jgi:hypothetical protein
MSRCVLSLFALMIVSVMSSGAATPTHADLVEIFQRDNFRVSYHARDISERDWIAAGVRPCESSGRRNISDSIVDPGHAWANEDWMAGPCQLLLVAKNSRHEVLSYWERNQGGPFLHVLVLRRGPKQKLVFHALMYNDIPHERWTWDEIRRHFLQRKFDA